MKLYAGILKRGIQEAEKSNFRFRVGAVIFKGPRIITASHNQDRQYAWKLQPFRENSRFLHAEQAAVLKSANKDIKGFSIFVIRINRNTGRIGLSFPCEDCFDMITMYGLKYIFYTNSIGEISGYNVTKGVYIHV